MALGIRENEEISWMLQGYVFDLVAVPVVILFDSEDSRLAVNKHEAGGFGRPWLRFRDTADNVQNGYNLCIGHLDCSP